MKNQCPDCGSDNEPDSRFCGQCGSRLPDRCKHCGAENTPANKFCGQCGNSLGEPAPTAKTESIATTAEAERRHLTVMFCDLVDSTALSDRIDAEDLREVLVQYQDICAREIKRYGGYIARYMGDGVLVYFGFPKAHEDDPERAIRTGLAIIDAIEPLQRQHTFPIQVRLGIATGVVIVGDIVGEGAAAEHAVVGKTPNLAARLQGVAEPNQIVVSKSTRDLVQGFFEFEDLGLRQLKGIQEAQSAWRVVRESDAASRFQAAAIHGLLPLVGRNAELTLLQERWQSALESEGQVVLLYGEAGVGKSRIIEELQTRLASQTPALALFSCSSFHTNNALFPVIGCLQRMLGFERNDREDVKRAKLMAFLQASNLIQENYDRILVPLIIGSDSPQADPQAQNPEQVKKFVFEALINLLQVKTDQQPMIIVVEDAHWIDPSTLEFLGALIERLHHWRLMVLISARPEFKPRWANHAQVTTLNLNHLSKTDSLSIVNNVSAGSSLPEDILKRIVAQTDGIPLFVEQLTKSILESGQLEQQQSGQNTNSPAPGLSIPGSLQDSLMARLDRLESGKEVAQLAAVLGRSFDMELLRKVSSLDSQTLESALGKLVDAELVYCRSLPPDAVYEFKHAMVQDVAYDSLLKRTRENYHRDIARIMASGFGSIAEEQPERIAHHLSEGGQLPEAIPYWRQAAARSLKRWATNESIGYLSQALRMLERLPEDSERTEDEISILIELVSGLRLIDRYDDALSLLDRAQAIAEVRQRHHDLSRIHYYRGNIYFPLGNISGCLQQHESARHYAQLAGAADIEAQALSGLGDAYFMRGQIISAYSQFSACVALSRQHNLTSIEAANLSMSGHALLYMNELEAGLDNSLKGVELAVQTGNPRAEMIARGSCTAKILFEMGDYDGAGEQCEQALEISRKLGARRFEPINQMILAKLALLQDHRDSAVAIAERAVATSRDTGLSFAGPMALGTLALVTPDPEARKAALDEGLELLRTECVSHNYLWFYRDALETALHIKDWALLDRITLAAEAYTQSEPLPWMTLVLERAHALADYIQYPDAVEVATTLKESRKKVYNLGFKSLLNALDDALL